MSTTAESRLSSGADSAFRAGAASARGTEAARGTEPPRTPVRARRPLDPEDFASRSLVDPGCFEAHVARELFSTHLEEARAYAGRLRKLAMLWDETSDEGDLYAVLVADARRITLNHARAQLRDACTAVTTLPRTLARLEAGHMPVSWFEQLLRRVRRLTPDQRRQLDERVADWDLANVSCDRFLRELGKLIAWFGAAAVRATPTEQRDVALEVNPDHDGTARVVITGPIHEILSFTHRLDLAARAVQNQQRRALEKEQPVPFDIDGDAVRNGQHLTLAALRYALLSRTMLETAGIEVPESRFRLQVVVPAMTLLGESDAPGTIDGTIPLPAAMARHLAAGEPTWYRILTDPSDGAFLPLPPTRYSATATMREHLRLLDPVCAVPGCTKNVCTVGEADHIEEYNHKNPESGGQTSIENLHRLCWKHHDMKTRGLLDPVREPDGTTTWHIGAHPPLTAQPNRDLLTPGLAAALQRSWDAYEEMLAWDAASHHGLLQDADPTPFPDPPF
ncbi:HNH endonuclease signature motif containing protein [Brachybacterium sp. FME24]|uniref:HNH endonuclease signature motif containing protein n=1 Tax=Brachybacterium sp. FME24 TaxID=2742605 RepID=UPI0018664F13|nr:HNH endonuclease signature motif containing protein [Brachybacterium sp. FME24]